MNFTRMLTAKKDLKSWQLMNILFPHLAFSWCATCRRGGSCGEGCADPCDWPRDEWGLKGWYWGAQHSWGLSVISRIFTIEITSFLLEVQSMYHASPFCWASGWPRMKEWLSLLFLIRVGLSSLYVSKGWCRFQPFSRNSSILEIS